MCPIPWSARCWQGAVYADSLARMSDAVSGAARTRGVWPWIVLAAGVLAQQVGSKAVRDGLFLAEVSPSLLPRVMLLGALLSVPVVLVTSSVMARVGPRRLGAVLTAFSAALFLGEWALLGQAPQVVAWIVYLHVTTMGTVAISVFFSNVSEHFDPHRARLASSRVTSGAAVGGMIGGLGASTLATCLGQPALLLALALINLACSLALLRMPGGGQRRQSAEHAGLRHAVTRLSRSPYLASIAALLLMTGFTSALLDFHFKAQATQVLGAGPQLLPLFAAFHTVTSILTALVQLTLAGRALERLGIAGTLALLPGSLLLSGAIGPLLAPLWSSTLLRGASSVLESSVFRSAYEPLFTPLSQRTRRSIKVLIDVAAGRLGDASGSVLLLLIVQVWPSSQRLPVVLCAMLGAALALFLSLRIHAGYVSELAESLRKGAVTLQPHEVVDSTTRLTLSQTHMELERSQLLAQIAAQRASRPPPAAPLAERVDAEHEPLLSAARDLLSAQPLRVKEVFARGPLDPRLAPLAIGLLRHDLLVEPVTEALGGIVDRITGLLNDALLDPQQPLSLRRRIPRVLRHASEPRAALGLIEVMRSQEPLLRFRAASALATLTEHQPALAPSAERVFELVRSELREGPPSAASLTHVLTLLGLALDRDALRLSRRALSSTDARQRGTALEYLHSTVPEPLRSELTSWLALAHHA